MSSQSNKSEMLDLARFEEKLTSAQFARNGCWENRWKLDRNVRPDHRRLQEYLSGATEIAFEVFVGKSFFGIRIQAEPDEVYRLSMALWCYFCMFDTGKQFIDHLERVESWSLLKGAPAMVEIGAVNAWRSVGAFRLRASKLRLTEFQKIFSSILQTPLARDRKHVKALEIGYLQPVIHWLGLSISDLQEPFAISRQMLFDALQSTHPTYGG